MKISDTAIKDVKLIEPVIFKDSRGYFLENYNKKKLSEVLNGIEFVQDNESQSSFGVLRGLHYQLSPFAQSKLVRVIKGKVLDIAVDIRKGSTTFGKHVVVELSDKNKRQLFIPQGFAHGFVVLSKEAIFSYKVDNYYAPDYERGIKYSDPSLNINWQIKPNDMIISEKDLSLPSIYNAELFEGDRKKILARI